MMSVPQSRIPAVLTGTPSDGMSSSLRLELKSAAGALGLFDGAWWPRSRDLERELPALVTALAARLGRIARMGFNIGVWDLAPRRLVIEGHTVRLEGFHSQDQHAVSATTVDGRRCILLVIPPEVATSEGRIAYARGAGVDNTDGVFTILAESDAWPGHHEVPIPGPRSEDQEPRDRWESEGGRVDERV
jgi:hypothetical protein